ncbi:hypothetical protein Y1Q_0012712 [Alligator mississippiensis]|uniref:Uncharacterized protein n=1 Tax=Alligator mississippiensis TaxID=8496 RepID=A0A151M8Q1_ALLMI|nr:hypothetical protein Y1Q_0012712 [Alligator mississippiensis]
MAEAPGPVWDTYQRSLSIHKIKKVLFCSAFSRDGLSWLCSTRNILVCSLFWKRTTSGGEYYSTAPHTRPHRLSPQHYLIFV